METPEPGCHYCAEEYKGLEEYKGWRNNGVGPRGPHGGSRTTDGIVWTSRRVFSGAPTLDAGDGQLSVR